MSTSTYIGDYCVDVPAADLADPTSPTRAEWEAAVVAGEGRPTFFTGGIVPPGVRTYQSPGSVLPKHVVETRWMPRTYDEVREDNRALARRDHDRGPAFDGGCVLPGGTPFALKAGERVLTRADRPHATAREVADRLSRPKVTAREVAERLEITLKKEP